ncbi:MAG: anaerobic ribonucleoside-triphosphate reductase [Sphingobacterium sp.]|nr:anaerobic ribonucleoside-triphosphate reductase [Sphingobacterium sp.]
MSIVDDVTQYGAPPAVSWPSTMHSATRTTPCRHQAVIAETADCALGRLAPSDCCGCADYVARLDDAERQVCEVWNRVMGYHRPVSAWNAGKQQEHRDRTLFQEPR